MCITIKGGLLFIGGKERAIPTSNRCGIAYFLKNNNKTPDYYIFLIEADNMILVFGESLTRLAMGLRG